MMGPVLNLEMAQALCAAVLDAAKRAGAPPLAVAVLDARASIKAVAAQDGLAIAMPQIAIGKANAALAFGMDGESIAAVSDRLPGAMAGFVQLAAPFVAVEGAVLIRSGQSIIGAVAVTGDTAVQDAAYARAGMAQVFGG